MDDNQQTICLRLFKLDIGITHSLRDEYFMNLLKASVIELNKMGANIFDSDATERETEDIQLTVDYSLWMYRKRDQDVGLPRRLQFKIHNRVIQKAVGEDNA